MRRLVEPYLEERERLDAQWQALDVARGLDRLDRAYWRRVWEEREAETRQGTRELADGRGGLLEARSRLVEERRRIEEERRVLRRAVRVPMPRAAAAWGGRHASGAGGRACGVRAQSVPGQEVGGANGAINVLYG